MKHIKSKRYRKILRKEKEKNEEKNMESLEKDDPIKFKEVIDQLEKNRMKERMSLKHKNTSKWARAQSKYAKYSDRAREQVQEQLEISKQLTKKVKQLQPEHDSDEEESRNETANVDSQANPFDLGAFTNKNLLLVDNPWMRMMGDVGVSIKAKQDPKAAQLEQMKEEYSKPQAFVDQKERDKAQKDLDEQSEDDQDDQDYLDDGDDDGDKANIVNILKNGDEEEEDEKEEIPEKVEKVLVTKTKKKTNKIEPVEQKETKQIVADLVPEKAAAKVETNNIMPLSAVAHNFDSIELNQNERKKNSSHQITLSEAFADDDVIEEFKMEKVS
jgi:U3 small nucleolar RNA-associated protein 14